MKHGAHDLDLFYGTPSAGNAKAAERFVMNRFSVTRQLRYSRDDTAHALDLALFINGLPIATFELKNSLTKQTVEDAVEQYKRDRDPREKLFEFDRCMVHFALDDVHVKFCTHLKGKGSWFLPFNKGWNDGAGNPPNPLGLKTDYLWKDILTPLGLTDIIENYAQIVERKDPKTGKVKRDQIFPRFHQLDVVRKLLADSKAKGAGRRDCRADEGRHRTVQAIQRQPGIQALAYRHDLFSHLRSADVACCLIGILRAAVFLNGPKGVRLSAALNAHPNRSAAALLRTIRLRVPEDWG